MRVKLLTPFILLASLALAGCDLEGMGSSTRFQEDFEYSYPISPGGRLAVESLNGSIQISAWDRDEVHITGTKYAATEKLLAALDVEVVATDDFIQVRTVRPSGRRGNMGAKYVIQAPRRIELDRITSSNGSITINDIEGDARVKTSNGRIRIDGMEGNVDAHSSNGAIELGETRGSVTVTTSNGAIRAERVSGHLNAQTSNGSINAELLSIEGSQPVELRSSNGSVTVTFQEQPTCDLIVSTSNSSITVRAPASLAADLNADTSNASIKTDFEVTVRGTQKKTHLSGKINGGGPRIELDTSNGSIKLEQIGG